jgi:hypothetical protein
VAGGAVSGVTQNELGALLERAYRLALCLQDEVAPVDGDCPRGAFAAFVASSELLEVIDEARTLLVASGAAEGSAAQFNQSGRCSARSASSRSGTTNRPAP